jgi:hypothetical protein
MIQLKEISFTMPTITLPDGTTINCAKFKADVGMVDYGIGSYEYWGEQCSQQDLQPEVFEFHYLGDDYTDEIYEWIDNNFDEIQDVALEKFNW